VPSQAVDVVSELHGVIEPVHTVTPASEVVWMQPGQYEVPHSKPQEAHV
jgi:hypothetical protein